MNHKKEDEYNPIHTVELVMDNHWKYPQFLDETRFRIKVFFLGEPY